MFSFSSMSNSLSHSAGEDDAADEGARQRRVEDVRVLGEADAQRLRLCDGRSERKQRAQRA